MEISEGCRSGDGTLANVGIRIDGKIVCPACNQRYDTELAFQLHWKYTHDPNRHQEDEGDAEPTKKDATDDSVPVAREAKAGKTRSRGASGQDVKERSSGGKGDKKGAAKGNGKGKGDKGTGKDKSTGKGKGKGKNKGKNYDASNYAYMQNYQYSPQMQAYYNAYGQGYLQQQYMNLEHSQYASPEYREYVAAVAAVQSSAEAILEPGQYEGSLKSVSVKHGYGFIACEETYRKYGRDIYIESGTLPADAKVLDRARFTVKMVEKEKIGSDGNKSNVKRPTAQNVEIVSAVVPSSTPTPR